MSEARRGKKLPPFTVEHREKLRLAKLGKSSYVRTSSIRKKGAKSKIGILNPMWHRPVSEETRGKRSQSMKGSKSPLWRGGLTKLNQLIRSGLEYRLWREAVFKRDNWTCVFCRSRSKKGKAVILHADHIKPFAFYPELRFAIDNGRTLCKPCHITTETYGNKANSYRKDTSRQTSATTENRPSEH